MADIPDVDAWIAQMLGLYTGEVALRTDEHDCWNKLRAKRVIQ